MQPVHPNSYPQQGAGGAGPPMVTTIPYNTGQQHGHPITVQEQVATSGLGEKYNASSGKATGWVQFTLAIISIVLGIVQIVLGSEVGAIGYGIWGGLLFFLPTGILGVASGSKNSCTIVAYMVMSILSAMMGLVVIILASITAGVDGDDYYCHYYNYNNCEDSTGRVVVACLLVFIGLMEFITAIVASAFCCGGVCCGSSQPTVSHVVHYYPNTVGPITVGPGAGYAGSQPPMGAGYGSQPPMGAPYPSHQPPMAYGGAHGSTQPPPPPQGSSWVSPPPQYETINGGYNKAPLAT